MELQKVYVPVDIDEFVLDKESLSVPVISGGGMVSQQFTFDANNLKGKGYKILKETDAILLSREDAEKIIAIDYNKALEMSIEVYPDNMGGMDQKGVNRYRSGYAKGFIDALQILNK